MYNKPKAELHPGHKLTGLKEKETNGEECGLKFKCMYFSTKSVPISEIALRFGRFPDFAHLFYW